MYSAVLPPAAAVITTFSASAKAVITASPVIISCSIETALSLFDDHVTLLSVALAGKNSALKVTCPSTPISS